MVHTYWNVILRQLHTSPVVVNMPTEMLTVATLDAGGVPEWDYPIQTDNSLYIRQIYSGTLYASELRIQQVSLDIEAVIAGSLIVDSLLNTFTGQNAILHNLLEAITTIELGAPPSWYDPVQTDSTLYIKQAYNITQVSNVLKLEVL